MKTSELPNCSKSFDVPKKKKIHNHHPLVSIQDNRLIHCPSQYHDICRNFAPSSFNRVNPILRKKRRSISSIVLFWIVRRKPPSSRLDRSTDQPPRFTEFVKNIGLPDRSKSGSDRSKPNENPGKSVPAIPRAWYDFCNESATREWRPTALPRARLWIGY